MTIRLVFFASGSYHRLYSYDVFLDLRVWLNLLFNGIRGTLTDITPSISEHIFGYVVDGWTIS